mgnify:CR=1 FL=1
MNNIIVLFLLLFYFSVFTFLTLFHTSTNDVIYLLSCWLSSSALANNDFSNFSFLIYLFESILINNGKEK